MVKEDGKSGDLSPNLKEKLEGLEGEVDEPTQITRIKRLKELQDKLEGTHKIDRIKKVQKKLMIPQIIGILILFPFLMYINGASLDPPYFPIYYPMLMLFGWMLILIIESFVFRMMRIKRHKSKSTKYILAKNSMKKSLTLMVVALIIFGVIYTPFLTDEVNKRSSIEGGIIRGENKSGNFEYRTKLTNQGVFSLRGLKNLTLRPSNGQHDTLINVTLIQTQGNQKESEVLEGNDIATFEFDLEDFREWVLQIHSEEPFALEYEKKMELQEKKIDAFSIIAFFYVGVFLEWPAILYPIRQKYTGKGIYR